MTPSAHTRLPERTPAALFTHIAQVVGLRADNQMVWIHACRVIACVHYHVLWRKINRVNPCVNKSVDPYRTTLHPSITIPPGMPRSSPFHAIGCHAVLAMPFTPAGSGLVAALRIELMSAIVLSSGCSQLDGSS